MIPHTNDWRCWHCRRSATLLTLLVCRMPDKDHKISLLFGKVSTHGKARTSCMLAMMDCKCLHGLALSYLADICTSVSSVVGRWQLQSANSRTLVVPGTRTTIGQRNFAVSGLATWNRILVELRPSRFPLRHSQKSSNLICLAASTLDDFCLLSAIQTDILIDWLTRQKCDSLDIYY